MAAAAVLMAAEKAERFEKVAAASSGVDRKADSPEAVRPQVLHWKVPPAVLEAGAAAERVDAVLQQSLEAAEELEQQHSRNECRPDDLEDFHQRLQSFRTPWWFLKPLGLSPLDAARRGWRNVGPDLLRCDCCGEELKIVRVDDQWLANGRALGLPGQAWNPAWGADVLESSHSAFCPWRSAEVVLNDPLRTSDQAVASEVEGRRSGLRKALDRFPVVSDNGKEAEDPAKALALAGWEPILPPGADTCNLIRCYICLRVHLVDAFVLCTMGDETPEAGSEGEPTKKQRLLAAAKVTLDAATEINNEAAKERWFEPYASHRFYCPLYSRPEGPRSAAAQRLLASPATESTPSSAADSPAETAESLLKALTDVLTPKRP